MWTPSHSLRVWLYRRPTDMRKSYDGLSAMVKQVMDEDPLDGSLYVFINRRRHQATFNIPFGARRSSLPVASAAR